MILSQLLFTQDVVSQWIREYWLEFFGVVSSLLYIYLEIKQKSSMWVVGFISSLVYVFVCFQSKVYGYAALYIYYVAISIYGWYCWRYAQQPDDKITELKVSRLRILSALILALITVVLCIGTGYMLTKFTDSPVPYFDAFVVSLSIVATWMLVRKILEQWILWFFANLFSSALFFSRGLYLTAGLFVVYSIMSVIGWVKWKKTIHHC